MSAKNHKMLKDPRTCRVFFSSPFSGMEGEREELTRKYLPQIQHLCNSKGIQFVAVDMRWGITTEMTAGAQVIRICLRELDRSDLFVGFYGQRYGWHGADDKALQENFDNAVEIYPWLDNVRDRSVTEIEFLHGHLNNFGEFPAVICFRSKDYDDFMVEEGKKKGDKKQVYKYTAESEHSINMMNDLKQRVLQTEKQSLGVLMDYQTPSKGAEFMFNAIWKHLNEVLLAENQEIKKSKHSNLLEQHNAFRKNRSSMFIGGEQYIAELNKNLDIDTPSSYLIIGVPGSGKSAMLCTWISGIQQKADYQHVCMVYHFVGYAEDSVEPRSILERLCDEFSYQVDVMEGKDEQQKTETNKGERSSDKDNIQHLIQRLLTLIEKLTSLGKLPVIVIDGIDKIVKRTKTEKPLYWLPPDISSKALVILSTKLEDKESISELQTDRKFKVIEILSMDANTKKDFIVKTLIASGKELASGQLDKLVQAEHTDNPLYLKITLNEMVVFGYFRLLDKKIDSLISSNKVEELFQKVLQRLEDDYNVKEYSDNLVEQVMCCIYLSHRGISETELRLIFNIPSSLWSPLYFAIEKYIIEQSGLIQFGFTELRECVRERYLKDECKRKDYLKKLIDYYEEERKELMEKFPPVPRSTVVERVTYELPWLWLQYGDKMELAKTLADVEINDILSGDCMYVLLDLWRVTGLSWEEIADKIIKSMEMRVVDMYLHFENYGNLNSTSPGLSMNGYFLNVIVMFEKIGHFKAQEKIILRYIRLLKENEASGFLKDERVLNAAMYKLACLYTDYGNYEESFKLHQEILEKRKRLLEEQENKSSEDIKDLGASYHGLGVTCLHSEDYDKAEELILKCMEIEKPLNDINLDKTVYMNLGNIYLFRGESEKALEYALKYLQIEEELNYGHLPPEIGESLTNIGLCYRRLGQLDKAEEYYHRSLEIKKNAVGSDHISCTVTLVNLSVIEHQRNNIDKSIEYINEALRIFKLTGVPDNSREHLQAKENKISFLVNSQRWEEAVEEFLPFFETVVKNDRLKNTLPALHTDIVKYLIHKHMLEEALNVTLCLLRAGMGCAVNYVHLDILDAMMSEKDERPKRPEEFSLEYAHKLWPEDGNIVRQIIKFHLIPNGDTQRVIDMMAEFDKVSDLGVEIYNATNIWLSEEEKINDEMLIGCNEVGLAKYPDSPYSVNFMRNIANSWIRLGQRAKALPYLVKILDEEPDDALTVLITAECAFVTDDVEMGKKYCHIAIEKFAGEEVAAKAKMLLDMVEEGMNEKS